MNVIDLRVKLVENLDKQIEKELSELTIPQNYIELEKRIQAGREEHFGIYANVSLNESPAYRNLWVNIGYRERELRRAMGMVLLFSKIGTIEPFYTITTEAMNISEYSEHFWTSYGDFQVKSCSLLDSIGAFLAFVFFGIVDAPMYFNQVIDAIKLKHTHGKRIVLDGEPFILTGKESWNVLLNSQKRYKDVRFWRDEIIHAFSPLMYMRDDALDEEKRSIVRSPTLNAEIALKACIETYNLLRIAPLAADDIAISFIDTNSYHRNYYY